MTIKRNIKFGLLGLLSLALAGCSKRPSGNLILKGEYQEKKYTLYQTWGGGIRTEIEPTNVGSISSTKLVYYDPDTVEGNRIREGITWLVQEDNGGFSKRTAHFGRITRIEETQGQTKRVYKTDSENAAILSKATAEVKIVAKYLAEQKTFQNEQVRSNVLQRIGVRGK